MQNNKVFDQSIETNPSSATLNGLDKLTDLDIAQLFESFPLGIVYCRMIQQVGQPDDFEILYTNPIYHQITGMGQSAGKRFSELIPGVQSNDPWILEHCRRVASSGNAELMEGFMTSLQSWYSSYLICPKPGEFIGILGDISDRKNAEAQMRNSEVQFHAMMDASPVSSVLIDGMGKFLYVNEAFIQTFGYARQELSTREDWMLKAYPDAQYRDQILSSWSQHIAEAKQSKRAIVPLEVKVRCKSGAIKIVLGNSTPVVMDGIENGLRLSTMFDITQIKHLEDELRLLSQTDSLTGLANRRQFLHMAEMELARTHRHGGVFSMLMMDVDFFKLINDHHGHSTGDLALQHIARQCRATLRDIDTVGRIGGEEFAVLLPNTDQPGAIEIAERLRSEISTFALPKTQGDPCGKPLGLTISVGVVTLSDGHLHTDVDGMLRLADMALYRAKNEGRNRVCVA